MSRDIKLEISKMFRRARQIWLSSKSTRRQPGMILIYSLLVMAVGSLLIAGTLTFAQSALKQGTASELHTMNLYAAGSGIENAWQKISIGAPDLPAEIDTTPLDNSDSKTTVYTFNLTDNLTPNVYLSLIAEELGVSKTYLVRSTSTSAGSSAEVLATLRSLSGPYNYFLNNSFTTAKNIDFKSKIRVDGKIQCGTHTGKIPIWGPGKGWVNGTPLAWPSSTDLLTWYQDEVDLGTADKVEGNWTPSVDTISLAKTTYVNGNFTLTAGLHHLYLNGHTLFVNGNVDVTDTYVYPTGCIVATGNVKFWPNGTTGNGTNGLFIFSIGSVGAEFLANAYFYGWIASQNGIEVKSGNDPAYNWIAPPTSGGVITLDFPGLNTTGGAGEKPWTVQVAAWDAK